VQKIKTMLAMARPKGSVEKRDRATIRQVQAAECIRSMTEDRARELEKAMTFD
jgi:uncharacterized protein YecT (DUF1311 family)